MTAKKRIRVLVNGHDQKFWYPLQRALEASGKYEFKEDKWKGHAAHDEKKSLKLLKWADVIICEWALENAVFYSNRKLPDQKLFIRFHQMERKTNYPNKINYKNVSGIIFVGRHILVDCVSRFNIPINITCVIPNTIDTSIFNRVKFGDCDYTLGIIGITPSMKRLDLAYQTLKVLSKIDKRYVLRVKGASPASYHWVWRKEEERKYYENIYTEINASSLRYNVIFDPPGNDVDRWFQMVGYVLSPSDFESFHVAPAEGMASGTIPIIWKREGSSDIFPTVIKTDSPMLAAKQIDFYRRSRAGERYKKISQNFIKERFESKVTAAQWDMLLDLDSDDMNVESEDRKKKKLLIFFSIGSWNTFHRKEMIESLAKHLEDEYNFLIIEPGEHYKTIVDRDMAPQSELDSMLELKPVRVTDNIFRIRIMNSGLPEKKHISSILRKNKKRDVVIYESSKYIFGKDVEIIYWIFKHDQLSWVRKGNKFVYEVYDDYALDFETGEILENVLQGEREVLPLADHVFFTSKPLAQRKSSYAKSWSIIGNGVNYDIFSKYRIDDDGERTLLKRPVVGYLGNLSNFFNWELMCEVVEKLPDIDFVFYGQIESDKMGERKYYVEKLISYKNTLFTGRVTREEGAVGINLADVLIIPFVVNDAMHAVNPLKLWEYFATGKPVVSTPMDAIKINTPLLRVESNAREWVDAILDSIFENNSLIKEERIKLAKNNSWEKLTKEHASVIETFLR